MTNHGTAPRRGARWRTAIGRSSLSRPVAVALRDRIISRSTTVLDYGCGRGIDLKLLKGIGVTAVGWDPAFCPTEPRRKADVVNLGFVVNVIEDPVERKATLCEAFALAKQALVVAVRLRWDRSASPSTGGVDGVITTRGTFQKFFTQEECRRWIDGILEVRSIAASPGIFYVFKEEQSAQEFLTRRFLRRPVLPQAHVSQQLFSQYRGALDPLVKFYSEHGRLPAPAEYLPWVEELITTFGSVKRAFGIVRRATTADQWDLARLERQRTLLALVALLEFERHPKFGDLPIDLRHDVRALFGSYAKLRPQARTLLFAAGQPEARDVSFAAAAVGKLMPSALYVHVSALADLPPVLRIFEGCAKKLAGDIEDVDIVKLHRQKAKVSYLSYPRFDRDPHPALDRSLIVDLQRLEIHQREYRTSPSPPILHRKDAFVAEDYPLFRCFQRLTRQEERMGLLNSGQPIGTRVEWQSLLSSRGLSLSGHRVVTVAGCRTVSSKKKASK